MSKIYKHAILTVVMAQKMVQIPREEYERLKKLEELDYELIKQFSDSLDDLKKGKFKRLA